MGHKCRKVTHVPMFCNDTQMQCVGDDTKFAIMDTQEVKCDRRGLGVTALHSGCPLPKNSPDAHVLHMCPQRLLGSQCCTASATLQHVLQNLPKLIAFDEAHMVATSDSDFAPKWQVLSRLLEELLHMPMRCCMATCTARGDVKMREILHMRDPLVLTTAL